MSKLRDDAKLEPCPFCGRTARIGDVDERRSVVICNGCDAEGPIGSGREQAAAEWNRRRPAARVSTPGAPAPVKQEAVCQAGPGLSSSAPGAPAEPAKPDISFEAFERWKNEPARSLSPRCPDCKGEGCDACCDTGAMQCKSTCADDFGPHAPCRPPCPVGVERERLRAVAAGAPLAPVGEPERCQGWCRDSSGDAYSKPCARCADHPGPHMVATEPPVLQEPR